MRMAAKMGVVLAVCAWAGVGPVRGAAPGYALQADLHADRVVFTAEGDLWTAAVTGGEARRLTSHPGGEGRPRISPDGRWIAFTGQYDGNNDVFVVPAEGGEPRRLTWHPALDLVVGWTPDGADVIFSSARTDPHGDQHLFRVALAGGEPREMPLGRANAIDIEPESGRWAFTRTRGGGIWKRYRGGTAPEIWVGHPDRADYRTVTSFDGPDTHPMWHAGRIYFASDKGGTVNLWSMTPEGSDLRQHTRHDTWDIRNPAMAPDGRIVYSLAGDLHLFDPTDDSDRLLPIALPSERSLTRQRYPDPGRYVTEARLAPDGERIAVVARGEVFSVPVEEGVTLPVTRGSGARERGVAFDPEGERLVYVTDASREEAIVAADAWGRGDLRTVKAPAATGWYFGPEWSPDGKWIAFSDMTYTLYIVPADGSAPPRQVDRSESWEIREYVWSPDGRWLAYTKDREVVGAAYSSIFIYDTRKHVSHQVTGWTTNDSSPAWDPDGRYLYFLSNRTVNPMFSELDFQSMLGPMTRPYLVLLRPDVENPFQNREGLPPAADGKDKDKDKNKKKSPSGKPEGEDDEEKASPGPIEIELAGLSERCVELPVAAGRYYGLGATAKKVFYLSWPMLGMNEEEDEETPRGELVAFDLEEEECETFVEGVAWYDLRPEADKLLLCKERGELYVIGVEAPPGEELEEARVALDGVVIELDPREEWEQIYYEAWRQLRDFYWDASLNGLDWPAIRDQYATMLPRIATRDDLADLLAEMIGELSTSHTYTWGGDSGRDVPQRSTGLLGAVIEREGGAFRVTRIYRGDPLDRVRSPLSEPGVDVREGDYILAVNHRGLSSEVPFEAALENLAGKAVMLTVNSRPEAKGARQVVVEPLESDRDLIYADWVRHNREVVAERSGGRIGYVHIPDMGTRGLVQFNTWFYPQLGLEGMVVDARWNGGGWVSQMILDRLMDKLLSWERQRWGSRFTYPARVLNGPFVVLTNENAGSDGDIFPQAVQLAGLAPVIGTRSWGGVNGIRMHKHLVDGGMVTHPEFAWWDRRVGWGLEGHGVDPDIVVDNLPQELARGYDAQLERGVEEVLRLHTQQPPQRPEFGPGPDRSRSAYRGELGR